MAKKSTESPPSIDVLTQRYHTLNERKIQFQTQLQEAEKRLQELQKQAQEEFGTSDVDELQTKLQQMEAENEKRRADYQQLLEGIQADLQKIEAGTAGESKPDAGQVPEAAG